jgi:hypothetical protein
MLPFELSPREERAHVRRGSLQRIARFLLARQRPVNGNLEDLVAATHRPRIGIEWTARDIIEAPSWGDQRHFPDDPFTVHVMDRSAAVGDPPLAAGIGAMPKRPATRDCTGSCKRPYAYGQLRMNTA